MKTVVFTSSRTPRDIGLAKTTVTVYILRKCIMVEKSAVESSSWNVTPDIMSGVEMSCNLGCGCQEKVTAAKIVGVVPQFEKKRQIRPELEFVKEWVVK